MQRSQQTIETMKMRSKMAQQLATLVKQRLNQFNEKKKKNTKRTLVSEEEMDNIANEALEAVLGCT